MIEPTPASSIIRPKAWQSKNGAGEVHSQHPPPLLGRGVLSRCDERDPSVVDKDVDAPEPLSYLLGEPRHVRLHRHVTGNVQHLPASLVHGPHRLGGFAQVDQCEGVPTICEHLRRAPTDPLRRSGDGRNPCGRRQA